MKLVCWFVNESPLPTQYIITPRLGRGTATSEGLSIAQAVAEHLHNKIG